VDPFTTPRSTGHPFVQLDGANVNVEFTGCSIDDVLVPDTMVQNRTDGTTESRVATSSGGVLVAGRRQQRGSTEDDEKDAAKAVASAWNRLRGTAYESVWESNKNEYPDAFLRSARTGEPQVQLQVRQLRDPLTKAFKQGQLSRHRLKSLSTDVQRSIQDKATIDTAEKAKTVLVLFCPVSIGHKAREQIMGTTFDYEGFREIWVCSFAEDAFSLRKLPTGSGPDAQRG
jgi:hypothetical protein